MKRPAWIAPALAASLLAACGAAPIKPTPALIYSSATHQRIASVPKALGLMLPRVAAYRCGGTYTPAQQTAPSASPSIVSTAEPGPYFWQLQLTCVDPSLQENLPKGTIRAGMVWLFESSAGGTLAQLPAALQIRGARDVRLGTHETVEGAMDFGGYRTNVLAFFGDETTYVGWGRRRQERVLLELTGRAVPMPVLALFARETRPASSSL